MNQGTFVRLIATIVLTSALSVSGMNVFEQKLHDLEGIYQILQRSTVASPQLIQDIYRETRSLDDLIAQYTQDDRVSLIVRVKRLQLQYQHVFRRAVRRQITNSFHLDQDKIYKIIGATAVSAVWASSLSWTYFLLQEKTGNIASIDQTKILVAGLEGMVAELVRQGFEQYSIRVGNVAAEMSKSSIGSIASAASAMAVHKKTFIARPTTTGMLMAGLKTELLVVFHDVIEREGGVFRMLRSVKIPNIVFGVPLISEHQRQLMPAVQPVVHDALVRPEFQQALQQILLVATESVLIGILTYYAGLGFADERIVSDAVVGAAYRGLIEGMFSYAVNISGGILQTTAAGGLSRALQNQIVKNAGLAITDPDAVTILIEKSAHTALVYALDESGGLGNFTKSVVAKTARAVNQKWWMPFKEFCNQIGDTILSRMGVPLES